MAGWFLKILIIGGYGTFGGRLVELLENESSLTLFVAGRSLEKARDFCSSRKTAKATLIPAEFDRTGDLDDQIKKNQPQIIVDASGPFQAYGEKPYLLVAACIRNKIHYMDLADGSAFVDGIHKFDNHAKAADVFILSGVSSFPVLSAAVVRELAKGMPDIYSIHVGIAPSPYAGVGGNVLRAIAGYAGQKIKIHQAGRMDHGYPITETMRYTISPPGRLPLYNKLFSLVDVPDLRVLSTVRPDAKKIWVGAGPVPEIFHIALIGFAWLVRKSVLKNLLFMVPLMELVTSHIRWGEHRGGMFVEVTRKNNKGQIYKKSWHLLAEGRDGPLIPSMAVEAIIRMILKGNIPEAGARSAVNDINLSDYDELFAGRTIYTGFREELHAKQSPLYKAILGKSYDELPQPIQELHDLSAAKSYEGQADILRGYSFLSRIITGVFRFPHAGQKVKVRVDFSQIHGMEKWTRSFAGKSFTSYQFKGRGHSERLIIERFGIFNFALALVIIENRLHLITRRWNCLGIPLPLWLAPRSDSFEYIEDDKFHFNVKISHPWTGLIVHYKGWLLRKS
ncbi:MAG: saccharopine dehydrogenase [Micavibrio aeruginosavorus]|uniref:Saccharopine dehydrogenase n=1 Tax=Micavibrio aeruginosavorus TaxID=349221 RepID=A0A2W5HBA3_9BACT|nr:MAG: saccharopine dehydrogenase [Micavibrio aeruginosavorus]